MCYKCGTDDASYDKEQDKCRSCEGFVCTCNMSYCLICREQNEQTVAFVGRIINRE